MMVYNPNIDLVNDNVCTKLVNSVYSFSRIEQNLILTSIKGHNSIASFAKNDTLQSQPRSCQY